MEENKFENIQECVGAAAPETVTPKEEKVKFNWDYSAQDDYNRKKQRRESRRGTAIYVLCALLVFALGFAGIGAVALLDSCTQISPSMAAPSTPGSR